MELSGRTAVVIGAGSGVGRGIALAFGEAGMNVVVGDIEVGPAEAVRSEIDAAGGTAIAVRVDGTERDDLRALADAAEERFGSIHLLSNNIGVAAIMRLDDADELDWGWAIEMNLLTMVRAVEVFRPRLRAHGAGAHIVNTASTAALVVITSPEHGWGAGQPIGLYTATKHAVLGYTETLRGELAHEGIGVSVLCPGGVPSNARATSARNRPARWGGPYDPGPAPDYPTPRLTAVDVGRAVVRGVEANRFHILSHPEWQADVVRRHEALLADFAFFADESGPADDRA